MDSNTPPIRQQDDFFTILENSFKLIKESWEALLLNLGTFILVYVLPFLIVAAAFLILSGVAITNEGKVNLDTTEALLGSIVGIGILVLFVMVMIATTITQLASARGKKIGFQEVISQSQPFFWRFVGLGVLSTLMILGGLVLLIIPGIIIGVMLLFSAYVMVDKNLGVIDSIKASFDITKKNWKIVLAFIVLQFAIQLPQVIPFLGAIATTVLSIAYFCLQAILYLRMVEAETPKQVTQSS